MIIEFICMMGIISGFMLFVMALYVGCLLLFDLITGSHKGRRAVRDLLEEL